MPLSSIADWCSFIAISKSYFVYSSSLIEGNQRSTWNDKRLCSSANTGAGPQAARWDCGECNCTALKADCSLSWAEVHNGRREFFFTSASNILTLTSIINNHKFITAIVLILVQSSCRNTVLLYYDVLQSTSPVTFETKTNWWPTFLIFSPKNKYFMARARFEPQHVKLTFNTKYFLIYVL